MRPRRSKVFKFGVLVASCAIALAITEVIARSTMPRYEYAASSEYFPDASRIWSRVPGSSTTRTHPDNGRRHLVIHNNFGLRQHRDVSLPAQPGETRVGLFGDSSTENLRMPAQASLSEVLDYLLSQSVAPPRTATVLNFGVDGYGTDQSFLHWESSPAARGLDLVIYLFDTNDIRNIYENDLFFLDTEDRLLRRTASVPPIWIRAVSRLYLTYVAIDAYHGARALSGGSPSEPTVATPLAGRRVSESLSRSQQERFRDATGLATQRALESGRGSEPLVENVALLRQILELWRDRVESEGGRFVVALPPGTPPEMDRSPFVGLEVIDLRIVFERQPVAPASWRFVNDGHWNELGNMMAAIAIYERYAKELGGIALPHDRVLSELCDYYVAFPDLWRPGGCAASSEDPSRSREIRARYAALERSGVGLAHSPPAAPRN